MKRDTKNTNTWISFGVSAQERRRFVRVARESLKGEPAWGCLSRWARSVLRLAADAHDAGRQHG